MLNKQLKIVIYILYIVDVLCLILRSQDMEYSSGIFIRFLLLDFLFHYGFTEWHNLIY